MPSQLVCRPESRPPVAVLRLTGTLDAVTGDALQQAVRRALAAQPTRLLLDLAAVRVGDPLGLAALRDVAGQTRDWPDVPIVLCGAAPETRRAISSAASCAGLSCAGLEYADSCEAAIAEGRREPEPPRVRARLRPAPDACRQVRQLVTQACERWQRADLAETAALIASELVANVVRHARTTMEFTFGQRNGRLSMAVRDGSRSLPEPGEPGVGSAGGRGLLLVRDLTEAWGVMPVSDGKVVWTRLGAAL